MNTTIRGSITAAPTTSDECIIPNGVSIADFKLDSAAPAQTGLMTRNLASPGGFTPLDGPGVTVAQVLFLYFRSTADIEIEITQDGSPRVIVGRFIVMQFDATKPVTAMRAKGVAKIEYFASGPQ